MKRNKEWWTRLSRKEQKELVYLEKKSNNYSSYGSDGYLPDDCNECSSCGTPMLGIGLCDSCNLRLSFLLAKASNNKIKKEECSTCRGLGTIPNNLYQFAPYIICPKCNGKNVLLD